MLRLIFRFFIFGVVLLAMVGGVSAIYAYQYLVKDLPDIHTVDDYRPPAVSRIISEDGVLIAELFKERRYPATLEQIPLVMRQAILAAEDASFYEHPGIDPFSILRALVKNVQSGESSQGGSTITQQVIKNLLLTPKKTIERKVREAILSYQLEKRVSKDGILEIYLNQIYFGNTAYGVAAAAQQYFRKDLSDLTLPEAAMLAGLPKAPSVYSPIHHFNKAKRRQKYVLGQMVNAGFITKQEAQEAENAELQLFKAKPNRRFYEAPYFLREFRMRFQEKFPQYNLEHDGLTIEVTVNRQANEMARKSLRAGLRVVDKRQGWKGPLAQGMKPEEFYKQYGTVTHIDEDELYPALVTSVNAQSKTASVALAPDNIQTIDLKKSSWARKRVDEDGKVLGIRPLMNEINPGSVIEVSLQGEKEPELLLDQTPHLEGAITLIDPHSGKVRAMVGGYDYARSEFNRATQSMRQPGSAFKPFVYLAALDGFGYTPATIVYDSPASFKVGDDYWTPGNFDGKFLGPITLQTALERSRNLVVTRLVSSIGVAPVIEYARKLGVKSPLKKNLSLSLGSNEVTLLEIVRAYGVFAAQGVLYDSVLIEKITDRNGDVLYDYSEEQLSLAKRVISEEAAFLMAHMMKGVVQRGTARRILALKRPAAGKTGTTNDQMDAWFVGYTPHWSCGVWVGYDTKRMIGPRETGGRVSGPIWLEFMKSFLEYDETLILADRIMEAKREAAKLGIEYVPPQELEPPDFSVPEGVDPYLVNRYTGTLTTSEDSSAIQQYFLRGQTPSRTAPQEEDSVDSYLDSPYL